MRPPFPASPAPPVGIHACHLQPFVSFPSPNIYRASRSPKLVVLAVCYLILRCSSRAGLDPKTCDWFSFVFPFCHVGANHFLLRLFLFFSLSLLGGPVFHPHTMTPLRLLQLLLLLGTVSYVQGANLCFFPNGRQAKDVPCDPTAAVSMCCGSVAACLSNGLCKDESTTNSTGVAYARGTCTDPTWQSPFCPQNCQLSKFVVEMTATQTLGAVTPG